MTPTSNILEISEYLKMKQFKLNALKNSVTVSINSFPDGYIVVRDEYIRGYDPATGDQMIFHPAGNPEADWAAAFPGLSGDYAVTVRDLQAALFTESSYLDVNAKHPDLITSQGWTKKLLSSVIICGGLHYRSERVEDILADLKAAISTGLLDQIEVAGIDPRGTYYGNYDLLPDLAFGTYFNNNAKETWRVIHMEKQIYVDFPA